jgi:ABC-type xylose transport system permease subunit
MDILWQDLALSVGSVVGLTSKIYALLDSDTVWSRWASVPNAILFIPTIAAFASLGLWITALNSTLAMLIWFAIGIWRAPDDD